MPRFERPCFIVNASSDRNRAVRHVSWLRQQVNKEWMAAEILIVEKGSDIATLAALKADQFDLIVACGGDGTVSRTAAGIAETNATLGILPIGSGNDFALAAGLHDKTLPECFNLLKEGDISTFDMIRFNGDAEGWCANTIGIGLDGLANYHAGEIRLLKGSAVYVLGLLKAITRFKGTHFRIKIDDTELKGAFLMATLCNGVREGGKFVVAPHADPGDGSLEFLTIRQIGLPRLLLYLPFFLKGPGHWMKGVSQRSCRRLEIETSTPVAVHCDGEHLSFGIRALQMEIRESVLRVVH